MLLIDRQAKTGVVKDLNLVRIELEIKKVTTRPKTLSLKTITPPLLPHPPMPLVEKGDMSESHEE